MDCAENNTILSPYYQFIVNECKKLFHSTNSIHLDLANDIYITLVDSEPEKIKSIISDGKIEAYICTIVRNQVRRRGSEFNRRYVNSSTDMTPKDREGSGELTFNNLQRLDEFEKSILSLYATYGSYDSASKAGRISKVTLIKYIKNIKKKIQ